MKYMLLIRQNPAAWEALSEADKNQVMAEVDVLMKELSERGEWVGGEGLTPPARQTMFRNFSMPMSEAKPDSVTT